MNTQKNVPLAPFTSLAAGGTAEELVTITDSQELIDLFANNIPEKWWVMGYGANSLISDKGLPGSTLLLRNTGTTFEDNLLIAESGTWWDDIVVAAIEKGLWGLELTSKIPGGVGAAVVGNIAAYGQAVGDTLAWIDVLDTVDGQVKRIAADELELTYRTSKFHSEEFAGLIILRAAFALSPAKIKDVSYDAILREGEDLDTLAGRRAATLKAREKAGSLWDWRDESHDSHNAGSFFRNPLVSSEKAEELMSHDESGRSLELLKKMNQVHGGDEKRVSAAHVLLAAGFSRGQAWGAVRLHPKNLLKIENTGGASAQEIYDVVQQILTTVREKLDIELTPEVRFIGEFN